MHTFLFLFLCPNVFSHSYSHFTFSRLRFEDEENLCWQKVKMSETVKFVKSDVTNDNKNRGV